MTTSHDTDLIVIDGVSHTFDTNSGQLQVLDKLTLGVPENGFSAIVGPSGCGKSTVTWLVAGLLKPDEGTVWLQGKQVTSNKTSYPISSFTRADRDRTASTVYLGPKQQLAFWGRNSPGPAVYTPTGAVGGQVSSEKPNVPKFGFGTADRFAYINIGQRAMQSPGPGAYSI